MKSRPYKRSQPVIKNPDRICIVCEKPYKAVAPLQKTCSIDCRRKKDRVHQIKFHYRNPDVMKKYNKNRLEKNPNFWIDKGRKEREEIIEKLGSKCCVHYCTVVNPIHLHIDYVPTMIGTGYRHPRHKKWVLDNLKDFRLLCANHHYELSITGSIENTDIKQRTQNDKPKKQ